MAFSFEISIVSFSTTQCEVIIEKRVKVILSRFHFFMVAPKACEMGFQKMRKVALLVVYHFAFVTSKNSVE